MIRGRADLEHQLQTEHLNVAFQPRTGFVNIPLCTGQTSHSDVSPYTVHYRHCCAAMKRKPCTACYHAPWTTRQENTWTSLFDFSIFVSRLFRGISCYRFGPNSNARVRTYLCLSRDIVSLLIIVIENVGKKGQRDETGDK